MKPLQQPSVQLLFGQVDPQPSWAPAHFPAQSGVQLWQPVWVHSSPWLQAEPVAAQTQAPCEQSSVLASSVQSAQSLPVVPHAVGPWLGEETQS